jgi:hypothetical protein
MAATALNLTIEQGATFSQVVNLGTTYTGLTPTAMLRRSFGSGSGGGDLIASFSCTAVDGSGNTTVSLTATVTAALQAIGALPSEREAVLGVWDMETINAGVVVRHRQGKVILSREATF